MEHYRLMLCATCLGFLPAFTMFLSYMVSLQWIEFILPLHIMISLAPGIGALLSFAIYQDLKYDAEANADGK